MELSPLIITTVTVATTVLSFAVVLAFIRLLRGPSLPDRVIALDLLATVAVGFMGAYSISTRDPVFLDAAVVLALVSFLGTVGFARYLEKRAQQ